MFSVVYTQLKDVTNTLNSNLFSVSFNFSIILTSERSDACDGEIHTQKDFGSSSLI